MTENGDAMDPLTYMAWAYGLIFGAAGAIHPESFLNFDAKSDGGCGTVKPAEPTAVARVEADLWIDDGGGEG